jgi:hypothetical protein
METRWDSGRITHSSELKELRCRDEQTAGVLLAALNSTLFFWFLNVHSDVRNLNRRDVLAFPIDLEQMPSEHKASLATLGRQIAASFYDEAEWVHRSDGRSIQTLQPARSFRIIEAIDPVIAESFGLSNEETDFIRNFEMPLRRQGDPSDEDS